MTDNRNYSIPDRSSVDRTFGKRLPSGEVNLGWSEGVMSSGRPYVKEFWAVDGTSILTFFFSREGMENLNDNDLKKLLETEELIRFVGDKQYCSGLPLTDDSGNEIWSVNVVIGFEDEVFASDV